MMTFPELLSNSEQTLGPLTLRLQQNCIRLPTVDRTKKGQVNVAKPTAALSATWLHVLYYTTCSVHMRQSAICILHHAIYAYCTGVHVSSPYIALSAPLMTTPTMVQIHHITCICQLIIDIWLFSLVFPIFVAYYMG